MQVWAWQDMPGFTLPKVVDFEAKNLLAKKNQRCKFLSVREIDDQRIHDLI